jgi:hypothetical protein
MVKEPPLRSALHVSLAAALVELAPAVVAGAAPVVGGALVADVVPLDEPELSPPHAAIVMAAATRAGTTLIPM